MTELGMALSNPYQGHRQPGSVGVPLPYVDVRIAADGGSPGDGEGLAAAPVWVQQVCECAALCA